MDLGEIKQTVRLSEHVAKRLNLRLEKNDEFLGLCPFHEEKSPSFRVYDRTGRYYCFGCQAGGDVYEWLYQMEGLSLADAKGLLMGDSLGDGNAPGVKRIVTTLKEKEVITPLFPVPSDKVSSHNFYPEPSRVHSYRNREGELLLKVARYNAGVLGSQKQFRPACYTESGWVEKAPTDIRPLFGLDSLNSPGMGFIVEGEKCAERLREILPDRAVITWMGGSNHTAILKSDWEPAKGRKWCYWYDVGAEDTIAHVGSMVDELFIVHPPEGKEKGWDVADAIEEGVDIGAIINGKVKYERPLGESPAVIKSAIPKEIMDNVPGLMGRIYRWMNDTAIYPLQELNLAGAITLTGILMAHHVKTRTNLRTNMYVLGISPSGTGKDHPRRCIRAMMKAAGMDKYVMGKPKSGAGLLSALARNMGKAIWTPDEMGRFLSSVGGKFAAGFQKEITSNMMELFSTASSTFIGEELANRDNKMPRIDIEQPCLNICGVATKAQLFDAMSSKEAIDGFLSRWITFECLNPYGELSEEEYALQEYDIPIPEDLLAEVIAWAHREGSYIAIEGRLDQYDIVPTKIDYSDDALKAIYQFDAGIRTKLKKEYEEPKHGEVYTAVWSRAGEHAKKLALCGHEGNQIDLPVMKWAIAMAAFCATKLITDAETNISDNEHEATVKRVLNIIRQQKKMTKSELISKTRWLRDTKQRDDILNMLVDSDQIEINLCDEKAKKPKMTIFIK